MATLAFFAVGTAIGPALTGVAASTAIVGGLTAGALFGAVGGAIGGFLDQTFLFPAVFGSSSQTVEGPSIVDVSLQTASEGVAIKQCFGPFNPVSGEMIWKSTPYRIVTTEVDNGGGGKGGGGGGVTSKSYAAFGDFLISVCKGSGLEVKKIWADSKVIYEAGILDSRVESVIVHGGSPTQNADSTYEADVGADNAPAYRGSLTVLIKNMALKDWGNRAPRFRFLVNEKYDKTVGETIADLCDEAGLSPSDYDVSGVSGCLLGYTIGSVTNAARKIEPLMLAYDVVVKEENGVMVFFDKADSDYVTISPDSLGAFSDGDTVARPFTVTDKSNYDIPGELVIDYLDTTNDYQRGSWRERRLFRGNNREVAKIDLPLVLTPGEASKIARRLLYAAEIERMKISGSLGPQHSAVQVTDILGLQDLSGETYLARITKLDKGNNNLIRFEAVSADIDISDQDENGEDSEGGGDPYLPPDVLTVILDIPPLREADAYEPGLYYAVAPVTSYSSWAGATVFVSNDENNWEVASITGNETVLGTLDSAGVVAGPVGVWDEWNSFTVSVVRGTLSSVTDLQCLNGANRAVLKDSNGNFEIIGFVSVVDNGDGTFTLSRLLRGLRGTDSQAFASGDQFVLLVVSGLSYASFNSTYIDNLRFYRGIAAGGNIDDEETVAEFLEGHTVRCFSPHDIKGYRDSSNNLAVWWTRRSRVPVGVLSPNAAPLEEPEERYEIDVYNLGVLTPNSPYTVIGESEWEYSATLQTADGLTPGDPVDLEIFQIGQYTGRGKGKAETV